MALTDIKIKAAKGGIKLDGSPTNKPYRISDSGGLYLEVAPSGGKWWRLKYRFAGKEKRLSLGTYPTVGLKDARSKRDENKRMLSEGIDPAAERKAKKLNIFLSEEGSFEIVGREWFDKFVSPKSETHASRVRNRLEKDIYPYLGARPTGEITAPELLMVLRRIEDRGAVNTAHRVRQICGQIFRYAVATGRAERDPSADLRGAIPPAAKTHFSSITDPKQIGELLRAIDGYSGEFSTKCALSLAPYVFVRPGELRAAQWQDIDLDNSEWQIPAERMKMKVKHIIPLSKQAIEIFRQMKLLTGNGKYVFPSIRSKSRPMSENTLNGALRRLGYTSQDMTTHGFRSMASTLLNEQGWNSDAIERQLAHAERNETKASYNYAEYLPERRKMMQAWADYLHDLKDGVQVIPLYTGSTVNA